MVSSIGFLQNVGKDTIQAQFRRKGWCMAKKGVRHGRTTSVLLFTQFHNKSERSERSRHQIKSMRAS